MSSKCCFTKNVFFKIEVKYEPMGYIVLVFTTVLGTFGGHKKLDLWTYTKILISKVL